LKINKSISYLIVISLFLLTIILNQFVPDAANRPNQPKLIFNMFLGIFFLTLLSVFIYGHLLGKLKKNGVRTVMDLSVIFGVFFFLWLILIGKFGYTDHLRFPSPNTVFAVYQTDFSLLVVRSTSSTIIRLMQGYAPAIALAVPIGLFVGRHVNVHDRVAYPIAKMIAPIPPVIFVPYAIELLPTIDMAVIFVIFIGAFWPIYVNTVYGVRNFDYRYIEAAKTLGASEKKLYTKILFPGAFPSISAGLFIGLVLSFIVLAVAEGIGGSYGFPGLGWYVLYFADLFDYEKIVAAILLIGLVVVVWTAIFDRIQGRILRWQVKGDE
jgi:NitT/TauT family transport system permease protein